MFSQVLNWEAAVGDSAYLQLPFTISLWFLKGSLWLNIYKVLMSIVESACDCPRSLGPFVLDARRAFHMQGGIRAEIS